MKKLIFLLIVIIITSCSSDDDCTYRSERTDEILAEIKDLEEQRDNAPELNKSVYQAQIDRLQKELSQDLGTCN